MEGKIRVIIKRPDEQFGHVTNISASLENLQKTVDGYIEAVPLTSEIVILCNEEGKIRGLQKNFFMPYDMICGTAIVIGRAGEEFCDLDLPFAVWKELLRKWGN